MKYTFEELPQAISILHEKVDHIKDLLLENRSLNSQRSRTRFIDYQTGYRISQPIRTHALHQSEPEVNLREQAKQKTLFLYGGTVRMGKIRKEENCGGIYLYHFYGVSNLQFLALFWFANVFLSVLKISDFFPRRPGLQPHLFYLKKLDIYPGFYWGSSRVLAMIVAF